MTNTFTETSGDFVGFYKIMHTETLGIVPDMASTLEVGDGQGGLACCDSWGRKESDTAERLN